MNYSQKVKIVKGRQEWEIEGRGDEDLPPLLAIWTLHLTQMKTSTWVLGYWTPALFAVAETWRAAAAPRKTIMQEEEEAEEEI